MAKCLLAKCLFGQISFWPNVFLAKCLFGQMSFVQMPLSKCLLAKCLLAKCLFGQMSFGQMSFKPNVFVSKCLFGQMSFWPNVFLSKCLSAKCLSSKCLSAKRHAVLILVDNIFHICETQWSKILLNLNSNLSQLRKKALKFYQMKTPPRHFGPCVNAVKIFARCT